MANNFFYPRYVNAAEARWPHWLIEDFPLLFMPLLAQGCGISLERLQVVDVCCELHPQAPASDTTLQREENGEIISLTRTIARNDLTYRVSVRYFVRGRRQFYRHLDSPVLSGERAQFPCIDQSDIEAFLQAIGQANNALFNKKIARLLGRREVIIPSQMLIALCLERVLDMVTIGHKPTIFELKLCRAVYISQKLTMACVDHEHSKVLGLFANHELALSLVAKARP